jgi:hypothetical protein
MKLSEAMILGSTMIRHVDHGGNSILSQYGCALECAGAAHGNNYKFYNSMDSRTQPIIWRLISFCPACKAEASIGEIIAFHLNDRHKWPIDRIAEWVASVEPAETQAPPNDEHSQVSMADLDVALKAK